MLFFKNQAEAQAMGALRVLASRSRGWRGGTMQEMRGEVGRGRLSQRRETVDEIERSCIDCTIAGCARPGTKCPDFCDAAGITQDEREAFVELYQGEDLKVMQAATETGAVTGREGLCRVEEVMEFARRMGFSKIGIATCGALQREAVSAAKVFRLHGFEVFGASCKFGSVPCGEFHCSEEAQVSAEAIACNPIVQAQRLNEAGTQLNVIIGLCVGHDSLFMRHSDAICTSLVTKDRALCNNPAAALQYCDMPPFRVSRMMQPDTPA